MPTISEARLAFRQHRLEQAMELIERVRADALANGNRMLELEVDAFASTVLARMERFAEARRATDRAMAAAEELGDARGLALAHCARSESHYSARDTEGMEREARTARTFAERCADPWMIGRADNLLAIVASLRGDEGAALLRYGSALAHFRLAGDDHNSAIVECNIGTLQTAQGDAAPALEHFERAAAIFGRVGGPLYLAHAGHAEALARVGRAEEALAAADRSIAAAVAHDLAPRAAGEAYLARGVAARAAGLSDEATAALRVAAAMAARAEDSYIGAMAATEMAAMHLEEDRFGEALTALERASRLFDEVGADRDRRRTLERIDAVRGQASERIGEWVRDSEERFPETTGHAARVAAYAARLAEAADLPAEQRHWCELGSLLHDIGYTSLPEVALAIDGVATPTEREVIRLHTVFGDQRLARDGFPEAVRAIVRHHHERWDGSGYPDGLAGAAIPRLARIAAVAERYDALRSPRGARRTPLDERAALDRLRDEGGRGLDPDLVERFASMPPAEEVALARPMAPAARAAPATPLQDQLQRAIGSAYVVERELAKGGMSRLFLAADPLLERKVVVKVLSPDRLAEGAERFRREMAIAAALAHPNIVPVLHAGIAGEMHYFVMPYVEGESIRELLSDGPVPVPRTLALLRDLAAALAYAHARGVTHRDIKPENVIVQGEHAVLMDFGIARTFYSSAYSYPSGSLREGERLTTLGTVVGTPGYMAPEQLLGDAEPSPRMDVYAFGALAWEMLAGFPPLEASSTSALMLAHIYEPPRPIRTECPKVPRRVGQLVDRCLRKAARERPADGAALVAELQ